MTTNTSLRDGQYTLLSLTMSVAGKSFDMSNMAVHCDVYESILAPAVIMELIVSDSLGLFSHAMHQDEEICLSFTTFPDAEPIHYRFSIWSIDPARSVGDDKTIVYVITGISKEFVEAQDPKYQSERYAYISKKIDSVSAVNGMLTKLGSEKQLFTERSVGLRTETSIKLNPFKFIDNVRQRAQSEKWKGSAWVFYENNKGYHFKTLQTLIKEGTKSVGDKYFIHSTLANLDVTSAAWRNILAVKFIQKGNLNVAQVTNAFNARSSGLDIATGAITEYRNKPGGAENPTLNEGSQAFTAGAVDKRGAEDGPIRLTYINSKEDGEQEVEKLAALPAFVAQLFNVMAHITTYGDTMVTVGDVITCTFPIMKGLTTTDGSPEEDKMTSGNYLVTKCRHVLTFGETPRYFQALEIVKDGVGTTSNSPRFTGAST